MGDIPSPADQGSQIKQVFDKSFINGSAGHPAKPNQVFYAVNYSWWDEWQWHVGWRKSSMELSRAKPGKINNTSLLSSDGTRITASDSALVFVPEEAWQLFTQWYLAFLQPMCLTQANPVFGRYGGEPAVPRFSRLLEWVEGSEKKAMLFIEVRHPHIFVFCQVLTL